MTDTLIARLRDATTGNLFADRVEAADRIEALQAEQAEVNTFNNSVIGERNEQIAKLRAELEILRSMHKQIDAVLASGAAPQQAEPVAWIIGMTEGEPMLTSNKAFAHGARDIDGRDIKPLYLAVGAAPQQAEPKEQT